jgi:hypothetical protein
MSDIFREVDEEIRHERYKKLWDRFGAYLIAIAVLIVVGTAAYRGWLYWQEQAAQQAGDVFVEAVRLADDGKYVEAEAKLAELSDAAGGYPVLARMRNAALLAQAGKTDEALAAYDAFAADGKTPAAFREVARLRAGYLALDAQDFEGARSRLEPLDKEDGEWRLLAREGLALASWKAGDLKAARDWAAGIIEAEGAPNDVVTRARTLIEVLDATEGAPKKEADSQ